MARQGYNIPPPLQPKSPAEVDKSTNFNLEPPTKNRIHFFSNQTSLLNLYDKFHKYIFFRDKRKCSLDLFLFQEKSKFGRFLEGKQIFDLKFLTAKQRKHHHLITLVRVGIIVRGSTSYESIWEMLGENGHLVGVICTDKSKERGDPASQVGGWPDKIHSDWGYWCGWWRWWRWWRRWRWRRWWRRCKKKLSIE